MQDITAIRVGVKLLVLINILALSVAPSAVYALSFVSGTGVFANPQGPGAPGFSEPSYLSPSPPSRTLPNLADVGIRWGIPPSGGNRSGLRFVGAEYSPGVAIPTDGTITVIDNLFILNHLNFPIFSGTALTGVNLNLSLTFLADDGNTEILVSSILPISIEETPNNPPGGCDFGSPPCPDRITLTQPNVAFIPIPNTTEFIQLQLRFPSSGTNQIITSEGQENEFFIDGVFSRVPAPAPWGAMAGLSLLSAKLRKLRRRYSW